MSRALLVEEGDVPFDSAQALSRIVPLGFVVAGLVIGVVVEAFMLPAICAALERRAQRTAASLLDAPRGALTLWATALGARFAIDGYALGPHERLLATQGLGLLMLFAVTLAAARIAKRLVDIYLRRHRDAIPAASLFTSLTAAAIWVIGLLLALQSIGIAITPVLTALGVGGLAVALALQPTLANLFSGLQIIASRQIRPGDFIQLETGGEGYVTDITWRTTTIRDAAEHLIVVPNAKLAQASFTSFAMPAQQASVVIPVLIGYDSDLEAVERAALEVAREVIEASGAQLDGFEPSVRFTEFTNENIKLNIFVRAGDSVDPPRLRSDLIKRLHARFRHDGIRSPFPARTAEPAPPAC